MTNQSLVSLADQGMLPDFQYMDSETCRWIESHNPNFTEAANRTKLRNKPPLALKLNEGWFLEKRIVGSLHGVRHLLRTAFYANILAGVQGLDLKNRCAVVLAALLHDIRRQDDKGDPAHGSRSAYWVQQQSVDIQKEWRIVLGDDQKQIIETVIGLHETPYADFSSEQQRLYGNHTVAVDILKTADALDRYRLPKLRWWIDDACLRLIPPDWLKQVAFNLVLHSEKHYLANGDSQLSVTATIEDLYAD